MGEAAAETGTDDEGAAREAPVATTRVTGKSASKRVTGFRFFLRIVTGFALLSWIARGAFALVGGRTSAQVELVQGGLKVRERVEWLGRPLREREATFSSASLVGAGRDASYPALHSLVGLTSLALGIVIGGSFVLDGVRSGETILLLVAACIVLGGAGLDLVLATLYDGLRSRVTIELALMPSTTLRIGDVPVAEAEKFLATIEKQAREA